MEWLMYWYDIHVASDKYKNISSVSSILTYYFHRLSLQKALLCKPNSAKHRSHLVPSLFLNINCWLRRPTCHSHQHSPTESGMEVNVYSWVLFNYSDYESCLMTSFYLLTPRDVWLISPLIMLSYWLKPNFELGQEIIASLLPYFILIFSYSGQKINISLQGNRAKLSWNCIFVFSVESWQRRWSNDLLSWHN